MLLLVALLLSRNKEYLNLLNPIRREINKEELNLNLCVCLVGSVEIEIGNYCTQSPNQIPIKSNRIIIGPIANNLSFSNTVLLCPVLANTSLFHGLLRSGSSGCSLV